MKCEHCKWWVRNRKFTYVTVGRCDGVNHSSRREIVSEDENAELWVDGDFSCIEFEAKEEDETK